MTFQRNHHYRLLLSAFCLSFSPLFSWAATPVIAPPEPQAIELASGATTVSADDAPFRDMVAKVKLDGLRVTASLPRGKVGVGVWPVIWTAIDPAEPDHPAARRESFLFVLPHGMTPLGAGVVENAVAANNTAHILEDPSGAVHMVWIGPSGATYRRARLSPDGTVHFETDPTPLGPHPGNWASLPTLAVAGNTVHFVWQADTILYRSLTRDGDTWRWGDEIDTKVASTGRDTGPSLAADSNAIHFLAQSGIYATSIDGGRVWTTEKVPFGPGYQAKGVSLSLDNKGRPLAAANYVVDGPTQYSQDQGRGGYWTIRIARRVAPGKWEAVPGPVDERPEWAHPTSKNEDVLTDWIRIMGDPSGGIHMSWHGTAVGRIFGHDRAYYAWRSPNGDWTPPVALRDPDPDHGYGWSYAPSLALDGELTLALPFHVMNAGSQARGFDSDLALLRSGKLIAPLLPVTTFARDSIISGEPRNALSSWFPEIAPTVARDSETGRVRADILVDLAPTSVQASPIVVWIQKDLTDWIKAAGQ